MPKQTPEDYGTYIWNDGKKMTEFESESVDYRSALRQKKPEFPMQGLITP